MTHATHALRQPAKFDRTVLSRKQSIKIHTLDIAPPRSESPLQKRPGRQRQKVKNHRLQCLTDVTALRMYRCSIVKSRQPNRGGLQRYDCFVSALRQSTS